MKPIIFTIESTVVLTIGQLLQSDLFECGNVITKDESIKPTANSPISSFISVLFGVKRQSSFGFHLSHDGNQYQLSLSPFAPPSDWAGAILFLKMLLVITEAKECQLNGMKFTVETIGSFPYHSLVLEGISGLTKELQLNPNIQLEGIRRPIYINELFLGQIIHVNEDQLFESYDKRLKLTQQIGGYQSEQQVFKIEQENANNFITVNYLNSEVPTILPAKAELSPENLKKYANQRILESRLFIMDRTGNKLADVPYDAFLQSLTENVFMLDAKYVVVEPLKEKLHQVLASFS